MMGITDSPYHACQEVTWATHLALENRQGKINPFKLEKVMKNLPGNLTYD